MKTTKQLSITGLMSAAFLLSACGSNNTVAPTVLGINGLPIGACNNMGGPQYMAIQSNGQDGSGNSVLISNLYITRDPGGTGNLAAFGTVTFTIANPLVLGSTGSNNPYPTYPSTYGGYANTTSTIPQTPQCISSNAFNITLSPNGSTIETVVQLATPTGSIIQIGGGYQTSFYNGRLQGLANVEFYGNTSSVYGGQGSSEVMDFQ